MEPYTLNPLGSRPSPAISCCPCTTWLTECCFDPFAFQPNHEGKRPKNRVLRVLRCPPPPKSAKRQPLEASVGFIQRIFPGTSEPLVSKWVLPCLLVCSCGSADAGKSESKKGRGMSWGAAIADPQLRGPSAVQGPKP